MRENERNFKNTVKIVSFFQVELANNPLTWPNQPFWLNWLDQFAGKSERAHEISKSF
jgi:hypothetical protein